MNTRTTGRTLAIWCVAIFGWLLLGAARVQSQTASVVAEQQPGSDLGAKIAAADAALGQARGEIRVTKSGAISTRLTLSPNHDLICAGDHVTLTLTTAAASIVLPSKSVVRACALSSSQTASPQGGEIFSQGASDVHVEDVTFVGGGYHIHFESVSNFSIKNTRHLSITAGGTSPIVVNSSDHGQITSPLIEGFNFPAGNWQARLIRVSMSRFVEVSDPVIRDVDASAIIACGGVTFSSSSDSSLRGGQISGLKNCDGVLTELVRYDAPPPNNIEITGTVSGGNNNAPGVGPYAHNGEGFDIFNSRNIRLSNVTVRDNDRHGNIQPGIEVSNSTQITISDSIISDNHAVGIKVDGSPGVTIENCRTNHNGGSGIYVMPALGNVKVTHGSSAVKWVPGRAGITFSAVWPDSTRIVISGSVYTIASLQTTSDLTLTTAFAGATGVSGYDLDSYVEITGGESLDNGQLAAGLPPNQNAGSREGVYFSGSSGELTGRVTRLHAADTQGRKTQMYGIRLENHARVIASSNSVEGNLVQGIRDSPKRSEIH